MGSTCCPSAGIALRGIDPTVQLRLVNKGTSDTEARVDLLNPINNNRNLLSTGQVRVNACEVKKSWL